MAFLGRCYGCRAGEHNLHEESFDTPPPEAGFVCGGGICVCSVCNPDLAHLDNWDNEGGRQ
jgi:hypothetical protein